MKKLNIVLVTIDTLRPDHLGCYGYSPLTSPHIDSLADQGIVFRQAITNGSYTLAAFPPLLSSTYASMYGGCRGKLAPERPMIAELLRQEGYNTAAFVSNPLLGIANSYDRGFEVFEEYPLLKAPSWHRIKGVQRLLQRPITHRILGLIHCDSRPSLGYVPGDRPTDRACEWLAGDKQPFFLWTHYMDTHWPYHFEKLLTTASEIAMAWRDQVVMHRAYRQRKHPGDSYMQRIIGLYDDAIRFVDGQVGQLAERLVQLNLQDTTIVIVTSDHGEGFFEHERFMHGAYYDLYDEILRVPLILKIPQEPRGMVVPQQVSLLDIAPTILEKIGIPQHRRMEGASLLPLVERRDGHLPPQAICEMWDVGNTGDAPCHYVAIRSEKYKYIYNNKRPDDYELYDLKMDPAETGNLRGECPELEAQFQSMLNEHLARVEASNASGPDMGWEADEEVTRRLRGLGYID